MLLPQTPPTPYSRSACGGQGEEAGAEPEEPLLLAWPTARRSCCPDGPQHAPWRRRGHRRWQCHAPAVLSGRRWSDVSLSTVSEAPKTHAAWGPASPNLIPYPSGTLPSDGTPRSWTVSGAAGMWTSHGEKSQCCRHSTGPKQAGEAPGTSGPRAEGGMETAVLTSPRAAYCRHVLGLG